jgi:hypothetical protein
LYPDDLSKPYLNKAAFAQIPVVSASKQPSRLGNIGKMSLRGPGNWQIDLNVAKSFSINEGTRLQFRLDMFNALNHTNWGDPVTDITKSTFGMITTAADARSMQLSFRLTF